MKHSTLGKAEFNIKDGSPKSELQVSKLESTISAKKNVTPRCARFLKFLPVAITTGKNGKVNPANGPKKIRLWLKKSKPSIPRAAKPTAVRASLTNYARTDSSTAAIASLAPA